MKEPILNNLTSVVLICVVVTIFSIYFGIPKFISKEKIDDLYNRFLVLL